MAGTIFTDRIADITYQEILPSIVDQINNSNILFAKVLSKPSNWKGVTMNQPINVANSNTGGSFSGMDQFPTGATNNTRNLQWYLAADEQSVVLPGIEKAVNGTSDKAVLRLLATRLDEAKISSMQRNGQVFYGYGSGKDFDGLGLIVDNGANSTSYGGVVRSTNAYINGDITPVSNSAISLDYLSSEFDNVSAAGSHMESPTLGLTTKAGWTFIEGLMQPMIGGKYETIGIHGYDRVDGGTPPGGVSAVGQVATGVAGFNALVYRGRPLVADDNASAGTYYWINEYYLEFARLVDASLNQIASTVEVTEGFYKDVPMPSAFQFRELMSPVNAYGEVGLLILMGNLIHRQPRRNGKLTGIASN
jgi:hypothetical protein